MAAGLDLPVPKNVGEEIARVLTIFRELRSGATADGKVTLKTPSGSLSTAEAIATMVGGLSQAAWFDGGKLVRRWPRAATWSARSSRTRCRTRPCWRNIWKRC